MYDAHTTASTAVSPRPMNDFDQVNQALAAAKMLADRIEALANNLVGQMPPRAVANGKLSEVVGGVLPSMGASAQFTCSRISDALEAIERIERALP